MHFLEWIFIKRVFLLERKKNSKQTVICLQVIPCTLAENAGLNPISTVTELRSRHAQGEMTAGINVRKGAITNILEENVLQPLLVSTSAITLASETVRSILKIDDIINTMQ